MATRHAMPCSNDLMKGHRDSWHWLFPNISVAYTRLHVWIFPSMYALVSSVEQGSQLCLKGFIFGITICVKNDHAFVWDYKNPGLLLLLACTAEVPRQSLPLLPVSVLIWSCSNKFYTILTNSCASITPYFDQQNLVSHNFSYLSTILMSTKYAWYVQFRTCPLPRGKPCTKKLGLYWHCWIE